MDPVKKLIFTYKAKRFAKSIYGSKPLIKAKNVSIGKNVVFGKNVEIKGRHVKIGDGSIIRDNVKIYTDHFEMGDYGFIYHNCYFPGGSVEIGHNFWLGNDSIVDGRAGTIIGNNVGIGAQSQLWTHMIFGDVMEGCQFHSENKLEIGDDVWLTGHNLVSPVKIGEKSMAMLGSLITKEMEPSKTYAGSPAKDMTERLGSQFKQRTIEQKTEYLKERLSDFASKYNIRQIENYVIIREEADETFEKSNQIQLNVANRTYSKTGSVLEFHLIRFLLPEVKFIPIS